MVGQIPRFAPPKRTQGREGQRSWLLAGLVWIAILLPLLFALMAYGYSDQAPAALRDATIGLDKAVGSPVWTILKAIAVR
jgi:hypothetical protein